MGAMLLQSPEIRFKELRGNSGNPLRGVGEAPISCPGPAYTSRAQRNPKLSEAFVGSIAYLTAHRV